ncbi:hypothetical protein ACQKQD_24065 [Methylobacterium sp. NPDC080182]|uniref:hypothetical protein n=1 Tax=Methylobacterium sp. NPDC080182 TaxID=3390590 RepID=UPI003D014E55
MTSQTAVIADRVSLTRRYVRSIELERDLADPAALVGYVATPTVLDTLQRILQGLAEGSTHRAFRITGPYGSGKSAFLLLLARLFAEQAGQPSSARDLLARRSPDQLALVRQARRYEPLVVVGRRESLGELLLSAVEKKFSCPRGRGRRTAVEQQAARLREQRMAGRVDDDAVLELVRDYARSLDKAQGGRGGVLILMDEMGLCLEHATLNRGSVDPSLFQRLGEMAAGSGDAPIAIVGVLHQRFAEYASSLGDRAQEEWTRSAERFEDLPFQEGVEQTAFLLAEALKPVKHDLEVARVGRTLYAEASRRGILPGKSDDIAGLGVRLYPLHPASVAALAAVARRLGQNERSAFGFLQGNEPYGFRNFIETAPYDAGRWYRLPDLLDHLLSRGVAGPRDGVLARRWALLSDSLIGHPDLPPSETRVLKCVGLLNILEPLPGLGPDEETVAYCLSGSDDRETVSSALAALVERRLLYRRPHRGDYGLWASTSVDLDGWLERARMQVPAPTRLDAAFEMLAPPRPIVAHRHYHETGTLRAFGVRLAKEGGGPVPIVAGIDGWITVAMIYPGDDRAQVFGRLKATGGSAPELVNVRDVPPSLLSAAHELLVWRWVDANCQELALDDLARREVRERVRKTGDRLAEALAPFTRPVTAEEAEGVWLVGGDVVDLPERAALHRLLSQICDERYPAAPVVHNELLNRSKLSSAAATARMRLLERMVTHGHVAGLGIEGTPPEKAVYLSVLLSTGLHREDESGNWRFSAPDPEHPRRWHHAWAGIGAILAGGEAVSVDAILTQLQEAPYGIRPGVSLVLLTAYLMARRDEIALLERNTFVPDVGGAHMMRLARNPKNFGFRLVVAADGSGGLLRAVVAGVRIWRPGAEPTPQPAPLAEAIFTWYLGLPAFARETRQVSSIARAVRLALDKATDPVEMLFERLPQACGLTPDSGALDVAQYAAILGESLQEIGAAPARLRAAASDVLLGSFGVSTLAALRRQVAADYGPVEGKLTEPRMRSFVSRTLDRDLSDDAWLDSLASLLTTRRLDTWRDDTLDRFSFEVRALAIRLTRWLAAARAQDAQRVPVLSVHVVDPSGHESAAIVHPGQQRVDKALAGRLRTLLAGRSDAAFVLGQLLAEEILRATEETADAEG